MPGVSPRGRWTLSPRACVPGRLSHFSHPTFHFLEKTNGKGSLDELQLGMGLLWDTTLGAPSPKGFMGLWVPSVSFWTPGGWHCLYGPG